MEILHSQILGEGQPFFILHGFLGMADNWRSIGMKIAEKNYQVHLIDQRNHGHSFHADAFSYEILTEDLLHYMRTHKLEKGILLGHSMGGKTAMDFATKYPDFVTKLIIADISPKHYPVHHQIIIDALSSVDFLSITSRNEVEKQLAKYILDVGTRQFLLKNVYWKSENELSFRFNLKALKENLPEIGKGLAESAIFQGNTLFLRGEKSNYITPEDTALIKKHFPKAEITTIPNAGHWIHADNPTLFLEKVLEF